MSVLCLFTVQVLMDAEATSGLPADSVIDGIMAEAEENLTLLGLDGGLEAGRAAESLTARCRGLFVVFVFGQLVEGQLPIAQGAILRRH